MITWAAIQLLLANIWGWVYYFRRPLIIAALVLTIFLFGFWASCRYCAPGPTGPGPIDFNGEHGNINAIEVNKNKANEEAVNANQEANNAAVNFNNVLNADTNKRESNFSAVKRKFCKEHPNDSKCK